MRLLTPLCALAWLALAPLPSTAQVDAPSEREVVENAALSFAVKTYGTGKRSPQAISIQVEQFWMGGKFAVLQGCPQLRGGGYVATEYLADICFLFCLQQVKPGDWQVVADLSSTDVPDIERAGLLRNQLPQDFPLKQLPELWRRLFQKAGEARPSARASQALIFDPPVNFREAPRGRILASIAGREIVSVVGRREDWYECVFRDQRGFIHKSQLRPTSGSTNP